jgi:hypothetical protein
MVIVTLLGFFIFIIILDSLSILLQNTNSNIWRSGFNPVLRKIVCLESNIFGLNDSFFAFGVIQLEAKAIVLLHFLVPL